MSLMEQKALPVYIALEGDPAACDCVTLVRKSGKAHITYRWQENGVDHCICLIVNTPTITVDDISASLFTEPF